MTSEILTTSFEYHETVEDNLAHPMSGLYFEQSHMDALNQAKADVEQRREGSAEDNRQLFTGIIDEKGEYLLLSIDGNWRDRPSTYTVRVVPFARQPIPRYYEEVIPAELATSFGLHEEYIETRAAGGMYISMSWPDSRFERTEEEEDHRGWSVAFPGEGTYGRKRIVSVEDALRLPTTQEQATAKIAAAQAAITISNYPDRYPQLNAGYRVIGSKPHTSQAYKIVDQQLDSIRLAVQSENLGSVDRERLVRLAHTIIEIADRYPAHITEKTVIDPNRAWEIARAEYPVRTLRPKWRRQRANNLARLQWDVREAQHTYDESLQRPESANGS